MMNVWYFKKHKASAFLPSFLSTCPIKSSHGTNNSRGKGNHSHKEAFAGRAAYFDVQTGSNIDLNHFPIESSITKEETHDELVVSDIDFFPGNLFQYCQQLETVGLAQQVSSCSRTFDVAMRMNMPSKSADLPYSDKPNFY